MNRRWSEVSKRALVAMLAGFITLICMMSGPAVAAQSEPDPEAGSASPKAENPNKRICRKVMVTGTHFRQRVCMKRREWDQVYAESQRNLEEQRLKGDAHITP